MMNKKIFVKNMNSTDKRKKDMLIRKVKKNLIEHVRVLDGKDYDEVGGFYFEFPNFKLKSGGSVIVKVMFDNSGWGDFGSLWHASASHVIEHKVKMENILK